MNLQISLIVVGVVQLQTAAMFCRSGDTPTAENTWPRKDTLDKAIMTLTTSESKISIT